MIESVSGIFVFKCVVGLWVREAKNAILYLYRKALILASELSRPVAALASAAALDNELTRTYKIPNDTKANAAG